MEVDASRRRGASYQPIRELPQNSGLHPSERLAACSDLARYWPPSLHADFTELVYATGKAYLITLVDHTSKIVPGWALGPRRDAELACAAWTATRRWFHRQDLSLAGVIVHQDQDSVFTGYAWTGHVLLRDGARLSYSLDGCRGNGDVLRLLEKEKGCDLVRAGRLGLVAKPVEDTPDGESTWFHADARGS